MAGFGSSYEKETTKERERGGEYEMENSKWVQEREEINIKRIELSYSNFF